MKLTNKNIILGMLESAYATDPVPDATNAMLVSNLNLAPMVASDQPRNRAFANFGSSASKLAQLNRTLSFSVEMAGSGAAGTAPLYGPLLRACGLAETITASTKTAYAPISAAWESAVLKHNRDALMHGLLGSRGSLSWKMQRGQLPTLDFSMTGLFGPVTDVAMADVISTLANFVDSVEVNKVNTATCTLHGYAVVLESLSIDLGNKVGFRDRPNAASVDITDRAVVGNISFEATTVAAKDWVSIAKANTLGALQVIHGTTAGNIVQLDAPKVQIGVPAYNDVDGVLHLSAPLMLRRNLGDDEVTYTVK
ncbi:MAG: phage tail tube protein [Rhizomicrobium sp.]